MLPIHFCGCIVLLLGIIPLNIGTTLSISNRPFSGRLPTNSPRFFEVEENFLSDTGLVENQHLRIKRDADHTNVSESTGSVKAMRKPDVTNLDDSHNQLVVYWAGLDVIVCLAKDPKSELPSTLYISQNYGSKFADVTSQLLIVENNTSRFPILDKFSNHPKLNGRFLFTDVINKYIFTTDDYGRNFKQTKVKFVPDEISFDPTTTHSLVAYETSTRERNFWVSVDFGQEWFKVDQSIKAIAWDDSVVPAMLYIGRTEPNNGTTLLSSPSLFGDPRDTNILLTDIEDFEVKDEYIFATKKKSNDSEEMELLISYKGRKFLPALFPTTLPSQHIHLADIADGQIFVCVVHNSTLTNLYIGNVPEDITESPRFSLSLERIVFFKRNLTWSSSWLNDVTSETFVELHRIDGLRGVYIASQFKQSVLANSKFGLDQIQSLITFDLGGMWSALQTPEVDDDGEPIYCKLAGNFTKTNCSLHISQRLIELFPQTKAVPILSQKSAVGIVMTTGTVDSSLKGHLGVFLSTDGAAHWRQVLQGNYLYNFGDHGGIIVAVKYYRQGELTNILLYSTDEGMSWKEFKFYDKEIRVLGLMTEPGENTTVFFIFGSDSTKSNHSWVLVKVDLLNAFDHPCGEGDYKEWSPWDSQPGRHCLLGRTDFYDRRGANVNCYNGVAYERPTRTKTCLCKRSDFECDFGYTGVNSGNYSLCVKDMSEKSPGVKAAWCKPGVFYYNKTKGYRKIPGDVCQDGDSELYLPQGIPCSLATEPEFMLLAKRDSVVRIDLNDFTHVEVLPLGKVRSVIAIDFDLKNNCIFWSDVTKDHIMKLHLDGESEPEILVSHGLKSVEGLAYDWMSRNLYFVDGNLKKIEVIRTDVSKIGRMRKQILDSTVLDKPRGIAVHPSKGYLFWTDWSTSKPCIGRSNLDGSNPKRIVDSVEDLKWPNGITIDLVTSMIYWADANSDKIYQADLDGKSVKPFLFEDHRLAHPFAVGVYKNYLYWDDWTTRSVYATRLDKPNPKEHVILVQDHLNRLMDLKVYGILSQNETNACSDGVACKHLCFVMPDNSTKCGCPDGLHLVNGECLCPDGKPVHNGICESNCNAPDAFRCKSGYCILPKWRCDGDFDCGPGDSSDEENCDTQSICADNQFRCSSDGKCIPFHWKCDLDTDCVDFSDEADCMYTEKCTSLDHFQCDNKLCVLKKWQCDGENDCGDNSDERNCTSTSSTSCRVNEFQCADKRCISRAWVCDGDADCLDGSDEGNCTGGSCPEWKYQCLTSKECIMKGWRCDGDVDCADHSDEVNCTTTSMIIPPESPGSIFVNCSKMQQMFQCRGALAICIPVFWVNDGVQDCPLGDDETETAPRLESYSDDGIISPTVTVKPTLPPCPGSHIRCNSGECIFESNFCDGFRDCPDGSDEPANCGSFFEPDCPNGYVKCGTSSICIRAEKLHDAEIDCPNGFDRSFRNSSEYHVECNNGQFLCDVDSCHALHEMCDGNISCMDGRDEEASLCAKHKTVYQVSGVSVEQLKDISRQFAFVEWWLPKSYLGVEFAVSYCEVVSNNCHNSTWTREMKYELGGKGAKDLLANTNYSVSVFVRKSGEIYPPAIYRYFVTLDGPSTPPYNLTAFQPDVKNLCLNWNAPVHPNGQISKYNIYYSPPFPPTNIAVDSKTRKLCISNKIWNPQFIPGTNYTFWITATNGYNTTIPSKTVAYVFHEDVGEIRSCSIKATSDSLVTLEWTVTDKGVSEYEITYESLAGSYQFPNKQTTKETTITLEKLASGTKFKYEVTPIHNGVYGVAFKGSFETSGKPLPKVEGIKLSVSKKNTVQVSWATVTDERSKSWIYAVVYGRSIRQIISKGVQITTNDTKITLKNLDACENYLVDVGVIGPGGGIGPMSSEQRIRTTMDEKAPPKNLKITVAKSDNATVILTWDAPCAFLEKPIGYNVKIREVNTNHTFGPSDIAYSTNPQVTTTILVPFGGHYEVTVRTNVTGSRPSTPALFDGIPISPPRILRQCFACNKPTVFWDPPQFPKPVLDKGNVSYVVWLSEDETFSRAKAYPTSDISFILDNLENEHVYYVAVSIKDAEGLESRLSEHIPLQYIGAASSNQITMSTGNVVGIAITTIVVVILLLAALGIFIVRHRRLQVSFLNFASSHYNTSSGAAVFQHSMEEEMDSPVIRGFSDDEPLLVA